MISFRFHLVSLIAVFLALGLGILVGSSVVDRVIVDRLDHEISTVRTESNAAKANVGRLEDQISKLQDFVRKSSAYAVDQRLVDVPVALVAEKGVDAGVLKDTLATLNAAGADVPGVLWLRERWRLDTQNDLSALQKAAKVSGNNASARAAALGVLARRLAEPPATGRRKPADVIDSLRSAGFLDFTDGDKTALARFPRRAARVLVVTGTNSRLNGSNTLVAFVQALLAANVPSVAAEAYDDHGGVEPIPQRGAAVAPVRGDSALSKDVSTVDDGEVTQGQVSEVIALEAIVGGTVGHYGYGQGASGGPLPIHSP